VYYSNSVADQFEIFGTDTPDERRTIPELMNCYETYFLLSTSLDDLWCKWESVKQTQDGRVKPITKVIIKVKNLQSSLPKNTISDFTMKQQFLDAMNTHLR
jgi:hypothetical protein